MIRINLLLKEYTLSDSDATQQAKLKAVQSIKALLTKIDHTAEEIPANNPEKLQRLLTSLKGEALNKDEMAVLKEIVDFNEA